MEGGTSQEIIEVQLNSWKWMWEKGFSEAERKALGRRRCNRSRGEVTQDASLRQIYHRATASPRLPVKNLPLLP